MDLGAKTDLFAGIDLNNALSKVSQNIKNTVAGLQEQTVNPFKAANNAISSGVALVDENTTQLTSTLTSFKSSTLDQIGSVLKGITGGLLTSPDLGNIIDVRNGFKVNTDELMRIGAQGLGFNISSISGLKDQIGDSFLNELDSMTGGLMGGLVYRDGKKFGVSDNWEYDTGKMLLDFLGRQDSALGTIVNLAGVNSVLNTMLDQTLQNGMYDGYESFADRYVYQSDYHAALIDGIQICLGNGDLESLNKILEIIEAEGARKVKAKYPTFTELLLSSFNFSKSVTPDQYPELKTKLLTVINAVDGPEWYKTPTPVLGSKRGETVMCNNLAVVSYITDDAKLLLEGEESLLPILACSGMLSAGDAYSTFMNDFPGAVSYE